MFDVFYFGTKPNLFEFELPADSLIDAARKSRTKHYWYIYGGNDYTGFDFDYTPVPWESTHIHTWPSQWQRDGQVYLANKDTVQNKEWHFRTDQRVTRMTPHPMETNWSCGPGIDNGKFDWTWHPDPHEPDYEYHFGTQWQSAGGPVWLGTAGVKLVSDTRAIALPRKANWTIPEEVNEDAVDFSWHPNPLDPPYIYHFGTNYQQSVGLTYTVPGATEIKFAGPIPGTENALEVLDIFFIDRGNDTAQARYERLAQDYTVTKVRYANSIMDTVKRCAARSTTGKFWVISSEYNYDNFDFSWHAEPWQSFMTHVFPSQHNKWSDTFLINKYEFERHIEWAKSLEEFPNLNFVTNMSVVKPDNIWNMYYIDHGNPESQYEILRDHYDVVKTRFMDNYLDTFKRIVNTATTEYVWILNSVCNYDHFDFTWQPEPWQKEMIHCFANGSVAGKNNAELRGDTFYIHVESFKAQMVELELLDWFNVINYVVDQRVERWSVPAVYYKGDNLVNAIKEHTFTTPYALFTNDSGIASMGNVNTCLWTEKDRVARDLSSDKSTSLIPRDAKKYIKTQVYDYPYLDANKIRNVRHTPDLDIVYISNGEPDEQRWYENACYQSNRDVKWIRGVNGRVAAYQAAARASNTDWFFTVFAKLEVLGSEFDWHWQPDYWQGPKHYIFNARNPVNGLVYGHMGMIAYNKSLVLANNDPGIDFTLSQPHESVPILSGVAHYNQDAWTTWRTAFREVLKLRLFMDTQPTLETEHRLQVWCTVGEGQYAGMSISGARDAVAYYEEVKGDPAKLQLSFEWAWLRNLFETKYGKYNNAY